MPRLATLKKVFSEEVLSMAESTPELRPLSLVPSNAFFPRQAHLNASSSSDETMGWWEAQRPFLSSSGVVVDMISFSLSF